VRRAWRELWHERYACRHKPRGQRMKRGEAHDARQKHATRYGRQVIVGMLRSWPHVARRRSMPYSRPPSTSPSCPSFRSPRVCRLTNHGEMSLFTRHTAVASAADPGAGGAVCNGAVHRRARSLYVPPAHVQPRPAFCHMPARQAYILRQSCRGSSYGRLSDQTRPEGAGEEGWFSAQ